MLKLIKQLFCKHKHRNQIQHSEYHDGQQYPAYGLRCKKCGKETWL